MYNQMNNTKLHNLPKDEIMSKLDISKPGEHKKFEDFVNMAVHELKTPVTVLKAYLQIVTAQLNKENNQSHLKTLEKMDIQLDKLLHLILDLQDGVTANSDDIHCLMYDFYIDESIKLCFENAKATNPCCDIAFEIDDSNLLIKGDRDRIEQVINNLITNAIKYSGTKKCLKIKGYRREDSFIVSVLDNGMGIPLEKQKQVFQQFYRVESTASQQQPGLGLGLFICAEIIRKHAGEIGVKSEEGQGSEFWFSLPLKNS